MPPSSCPPIFQFVILFFPLLEGSKFDLAGRVYKGVPASANLEIPPYSYESDGVLVIGVDAEAA